MWEGPRLSAATDRGVVLTRWVWAVVGVQTKEKGVVTEVEMLTRDGTKKVSTWGMLPQPENISKGGGRTIQKSGDTVRADASRSDACV